MRTAIYIIWFLIPLSFFLIALWAKLEQAGGRERHENISDYLRQGFFILICCLVAVLIESYFLEDFVLILFGDWLPLTVAQVMLLPLILLIAAKLIGGSTPIRIEKNSRKPGMKRPTRKR